MLVFLRISRSFALLATQTGVLKKNMDGHPWLWDLLLWGLWLGWVVLWFNRGFYPFDHGREALISYLWLNGIEPWSVNKFFPPIGLGGLFLFGALIKVFGFVPFYWRLVFVLVYGALCWSVYRLLARLVPRGIAWTATVPVMVFFTNIHTVGYLYYFWNGALLAMLSVHGFDRFLGRPILTRGWPWLMLSAGAAVASMMTMSLTGYAVVCGVGAVLALKLALDSGRGRTLVVGAVWGGFFLAFWGLVLGLIYQQGWLPGYLEQISHYPRHLNHYGNTSIASTLSSWWLMFYYSGPIPAPWSLLAVVGFGLGICFLARANPAKLPRARIFWAILYWGAAACLGAWLVIDTRACLEFFHQWFWVVYLAPPINLGLCLVMAFFILRNHIKNPTAHPDTWHWLLLLAVGGAVFMAFALSHRSREHSIYSAIIFMPVVWAYVWARFPRLFHFSWPPGLAVVLVAGVVLLGVAHRVFDPDRQASWYEPAPYHRFPTLRGLRSNDAPEKDLVLWLAWRVVQRGGKILVYPSHATIYPLVGSLPPLPFPDLRPPQTMYTYPRKVEVWRPVLAKIDNPPPDLIIFEAEFSTQKSWLTWREQPYVPQVAREVGDDYWNYDPSPRYRKIWLGKEYAVYLRKGQTPDGPENSPGGPTP